jgi:hypothetical protein
MNYWHKQIDRLHLLTPIGTQGGILSLSHHGIAQFCLQNPETVFSSHDGGEYVGHELIRMINGVRIAPGGGVRIPARGTRSEYGRSID